MKMSFRNQVKFVRLQPTVMTCIYKGLTIKALKLSYCQLSAFALQCSNTKHFKGDISPLIWYE